MTGRRIERCFSGLHFACSCSNLSVMRSHSRPPVVAGQPQERRMELLKERCKLGWGPGVLEGADLGQRLPLQSKRAAEYICRFTAQEPDRSVAAL